jgi:hypothetical protein
MAADFVAAKPKPTLSCRHHRNRRRHRCHRTTQPSTLLAAESGGASDGFVVHKLK